MSQDFGMQVPVRHALATRPQPVKYLVLIDSGGTRIARLYPATFTLANECDASSAEITAMTSGLTPHLGATGSNWDAALQAFSYEERLAAEVFTLEGI